ncbi:MAG: tetraacyldisaccharide 4'-kinase [Gemmatimonadaceae bacterium]
MTVEDVWYGSDARARSARAGLAPAAWLYGAVTATRNRMYDAGLLRALSSPVPVISVGNLTVGGTGKTPFTAHLVQLLRSMEPARQPAIVMRGYGGDEKVLHERLNPGVRVYASPDRAAGIKLAAADGADVVVLDDAFQHRRAGRSLDVVLVSAEQWRGDLKILPAGPLRESLAGLRRAHLIVVTSKGADENRINGVASRVARIAPRVQVVRADFLMRDLVDAQEPERSISLEQLAGAELLAIAGVGDPSSFVAQLRAIGAHVTSCTFADHHAYTVAEVAMLSRKARDHKYVVTTGKDAVKLAPLWPAKAPPLWYVSQAVRITGGESVLAQALRDALSR